LGWRDPRTLRQDRASCWRRLGRRRAGSALAGRGPARWLQVRPPSWSQSVIGGFSLRRSVLPSGWYATTMLDRFSMTAWLRQCCAHSHGWQVLFGTRLTIAALTSCMPYTD